MQGPLSFEIQITELPTLEDIKEFTSIDDKAGISEYLQKEFDAYISMRIGNTDILANYPEAFILPVHAFVKSMSNGLRILAEEKAVRIPIYLQQYDVEPGSRAHYLHWRLEDGRLLMRFEWSGFKEAPAFLRDLGEVEIHTAQTQKAISDVVGAYVQRIALLLRQLEGWTNEDLEELFDGF
ncbi:hypothetical protein L6R29_00335 [Myxococcota bacterium]|nr:hypothetical protein [Myxococcota bacterium]